MRQPSKDESKLPEWVRRELERLRLNAQFWKEKAQVVTGEVPSKTYVELSGESRVPFPDSAKFVFEMDEGELFQFRRQANGLYVYFAGRTVEHRLMVAPESYNTLSLGVVDRHAVKPEGNKD